MNKKEKITAEKPTAPELNFECVEVKLGDDYLKNQQFTQTAEYRPSQSTPILEVKPFPTKTIMSHILMDKEGERELAEKSKPVVGTLINGSGYHRIAENALVIRTDLGVPGSPSCLYCIPFNRPVKIPKGIVDEIKEMKVLKKATKQVNLNDEMTPGNPPEYLEDKIVVTGEERVCDFYQIYSA